MKKKLLSLILTLCVLAVTPSMTAKAEVYHGGDDWKVTFTGEKSMTSTFKSSDMDDAIAGLQPGDEVHMKIRVENGYEAETDWYFSNEVLKSLEDASSNSSTHGGGYSYDLRYKDSAGVEHVLFTSGAVGGEGPVIAEVGEGLHEATDSLKDFLYLDSLGIHDFGEIYLVVALDGESQGNDYQDTLAKLQMNFALELDPRSPERGETIITWRDGKPVVIRGVIRGGGPFTGDNADMVPYLIASAISGMVLLVLAIISMKKTSRRTEK